MRVHSHEPLSRAYLLLVLCLGLTFAVPVVAQQTSSAAATQDEINRQLLQRLQDVEEEVKQLKALLGQATTGSATESGSVSGAAAAQLRAAAATLQPAAA